MLFQITAIVAGAGQEPIAETLARIAVAAGTEEGRQRVLARHALGLAELFERFGDDGVQAAREARQGAFHRFGDKRRDGVIVTNRLGRAAGDELPALGVADVNALAGLLAEQIFLQFDKHDGYSRWDTKGGRITRSSVHLRWDRLNAWRRSPPARLDGFDAAL